MKRITVDTWKKDPQLFYRYINGKIKKIRYN